MRPKFGQGSPPLDVVYGEFGIAPSGLLLKLHPPPPLVSEKFPGFIPLGGIFVGKGGGGDEPWGFQLRL